MLQGYDELLKKIGGPKELFNALKKANAAGITDGLKKATAEQAAQELRQKAKSDSALATALSSMGSDDIAAIEAALLELGYVDQSVVALAVQVLEQQKQSINGKKQEDQKQGEKKDTKADDDNKTALLKQAMETGANGKKKDEAPVVAVNLGEFKPAAPLDSGHAHKDNKLI
jgi:hypothetical protein